MIDKDSGSNVLDIIQHFDDLVKKFTKKLN